MLPRRCGTGIDASTQVAEAPTHIVGESPALVVVDHTIGWRHSAEGRAEFGYKNSKTTAHGILVSHGLGYRPQRVVRTLAIASLSRSITEPVIETNPFGFCHFASLPAELVVLDSFNIGKLKRVGKVYRLTAVNACARWAIIKFSIDSVIAVDSALLVGHLLGTMRRPSIPITRALSDNGPKGIENCFHDRATEMRHIHFRILPWSPIHDAVVERFQGSMLQKCRRSIVYHWCFISIRQLQLGANAWLIRYNTHRHNRDDCTHGPQRIKILESHTPQQAA